MAAKDVDENFQTAALMQLECPVCLEYCVPPIYQCTNGHNVCSECIPKISECSLCRGSMTKVRNLFAEHISSRIQYPCKYRVEGCTVKLLPTEMGEHVANCAFGISCQFKVRGNHPTNNQYVQCSWHGPRSKLLEHAEQRHKLWTVRGDTAEIKFSIRKFQGILLYTNKELFWCLFQHDFRGPLLKAHIFCVNQQNKELNFTCEFTLNSENGECEIVNRRKVDACSNGLIEEFITETAGKYAIVSGNCMINRFVRGKLFHCGVKIIKQ